MRGLPLQDNATTTTGDDEDDEAPLPLLPETTAYWSREPYAWSTSLDTNPPLLTSSHCSRAVYHLFHNTYYSVVGDLDPYQPNFLLSVVAESSSHPAGLNALYAQPWMYAGPGLGNLDECPLQTCIAGGRATDSITFASVCMVPECSAYDLAADDFVSTVARQLDYAITNNVYSTPQETIDLGREYIMLLQRIADLNKFLKTGWTCGDFAVPFEPLPFGVPYIGVSLLLVLLAVLGTTCKRRKGQQWRPTNTVPYSFQLEKKVDYDSTVTSDSEETSVLLGPNSRKSSVEYSSNPMNGWTDGETQVYRPPSQVPDAYEQAVDPFWSAFDVSSHLWRLISPDKSSHRETACLDGLRVGSIFWIMLGHVMAIQSSSGAGYSNPANFLPPTGLTTTVVGQLLFSSRLAVDTFLTISGFLVVHVLYNKVPFDGPQSVGATASLWRDVFLRYITNLPSLMIARVVRILPLYAMCLGFYTQVAPHLGSGPFWHQWIGLLKPCHDSIWTNFLFVNNFLPFDTQTTNTCFYHSWYLAVDMQLFVVAPLLVFWYQASPRQGGFVTATLFVASVLVTVYLSYTRHWSVNTFDGVAVDRYDMEAYAKPHVRAQAYLAGMYVAMLLLSEKVKTSSRHESRRHPLNDDHSCSSSWRSPFTWKHRSLMAISLLSMAAVTFGTATGAYARRPCTYKEIPLLDECGSLWSPFTTFLYTGFSRTAWALGTAAIIHLSVGRGSWGSGDGNFVSAVLSWRCWTPLSQLSFGVYLIHPIVIFVWQLGDREKQVFRLLTFGMDYLSVCVVSYVAALLAAVVIEFPCAMLWKYFVVGARGSTSMTRWRVDAAENCDSDAMQQSSRGIVELEPKVSSMSMSLSPLTPQYGYGSTQLSSNPGNF
jgi:peptidoglycan/LPS O-acetylase OafA/YrhL